VSPWWSRPTAESEGDESSSAESAGPESAGKAEAGRADEPAKPDKPAEPSKKKGGGSAERPEETKKEPAGGGKTRSRAKKGAAPGREKAKETAKDKAQETKAKEPASKDTRRGGGRARKEKPKEPAPVTHDITPADIASIHRELSDGPSVPETAVPERTQPVSDERKIALFCDLENIALGVRDSDIKKFDINLVLERLLEKGKVIVKRAYCDWERYSEYKRAFHEAAIEMLDIPQKYYSGKNSADIKMVVDAMDLCYANEHLDTFVLLSGDSDFSPLVSKLREADKYVIGMGVKNSSSALLVDNCDEFIYYEDLWRDRQHTPEVTGGNKKTSEAFRLMIDAIQALLRENKDVLWGSMVKQTMQRKKPSFNEGYYGYGSFSELLEDAERQNILKLKKDQRSGSYVVTGFAKKGA
jgi:uncharacterized protein (TIGR00288 family)